MGDRRVSPSLGSLGASQEGNTSAETQADTSEKSMPSKRISTHSGAVFLGGGELRVPGGMQAAICQNAKASYQ